MSLRTKIWWVALLLGSPLSCLVKAQEEPPVNAENPNKLAPLSPEELEDLLFILEKPPEDLFEQPVFGVLGFEQKQGRSPAAVHILRPKDIRLAGHQRWPEAFRMVPGMLVMRGMSYETLTSMRSFNGFLVEKMLALVDGREALDPVFSSVKWCVNEVPLDLLDRIEIIKGPGATIWGINAVNGVINVVTKPVVATQGGSLYFAVSDTGRQIAEAYHGGRIEGKGHYRVWAKRDQYDSFDLASGASMRDDATVFNSGIRIDLEHLENLSASIDGRFLTANLGMTLKTPVIVPPTAAPAGYTSSQHAVNEMEMAHLKGSLSGKTENGISWTLRTYWERLDRDLNHAKFAYVADTYDIDLKGSLRLGERQQLAFGAGARRYEVDFDIGLMPPLENIPFVRPYADMDPSSFDITRFSAFVQDTIEMIPDTLSLSIGTKFEDHDLSGTSWQPGIRAWWIPVEEHTLWAAYSHALRQPALVEKYSKLTFAYFQGITGELFPGTFFGNSALMQEKLDAYEIGWRWQPHKNFTMDLALYHCDFQDTIVESTSIALNSFVPIDAAMQGGEVSAIWQASDRWKLHAAYAVGKPDVEGQDLNLFPERIWNIRSTYELTDRVDLGQYLYFTDEIPHYSIPSVTRLDLSLLWRPLDNLEIGLFAQNLLDPEHVETYVDYSYPEPVQIERTFFLTVSKHF